MRPRSIVFTLYGDYLRYCGSGEAPLGALVRLLGLFGVEPATARTTMSRLRAEGWFASLNQGRTTTYVLTDRGWQLLDEGRERIFSRSAQPWEGDWTTILTRAVERAARDEIRRALDWRGFGQLQPSAWLAPGDRRAAARGMLANFPDVSAELFLSRTGDPEADRRLAGQCWDLQAIDKAYRAFIAGHSAPLDPEADDLEVLIRRVQLTDDYRRYPFTDPDLPAELLPADWSGRIAHRRFLELHSELRGRAEAAVERIVGLAVEIPGSAGG